MHPRGLVDADREDRWSRHSRAQVSGSPWAFQVGKPLVDRREQAIGARLTGSTRQTPRGGHRQAVFQKRTMAVVTRDS
jgi:hypothetical protein